ncbi:MAG: lipocalin family protein [Cyclobacteriaceae bacterium]|nr:MAG: lipocalin family protein [Cyclobacteriaceae bacterium]
MRRSIFVLLIASAMGGVVMAQSSKQELLTGTWVLTSDEMSGIGKHQSLPQETQISFSEDGNWQATASIQNAKQGQWRLENNGKSLVLISDEEIRYQVLALSKTTLSLRLKKQTATYTLSWSKK